MGADFSSLDWEQEKVLTQDDHKHFTDNLKQSYKADIEKYSYCAHGEATIDCQECTPGRRCVHGFILYHCWKCTYSSIEYGRYPHGVFRKWHSKQVKKYRDSVIQENIKKRSKRSNRTKQEKRQKR